MATGSRSLLGLCPRRALLAAAAAAVLPGAAASAAPLCQQAGFWGTASCLAVETGSLARDAAGFALSRTLPTTLRAAAAERVRALQQVATSPEKAGHRVYAVLEALAEVPAKLQQLVDGILEAGDRWLPSAERHRAAFVAAFPAHAAVVPDTPSFLAAGVWLLAACFVACWCLSRALAERALPQVFFFPDKSGKNVGRICQMVASSRRRVWVAMFALTDDALSREILSAHARGLDVRLIVDDEQSQCMGADAKMLAEAGVPVVSDRSYARMHHKFAVLDRAVLSGSFNWTRQASQMNSENLIILHDAGTVKAFADEFLRMWSEFQGRGGRMKAKQTCRQRGQTPPVRAR